MDCTIKIIAGPQAGQEFVCAGPETYLGRSQRCAVRLASPSVSFEHALISRIGDDYFVENLSANGTLLNNERLAGGAAKARLRLKDQIRLGNDTVARVERLPAASAAGSQRRWLLLAVVALLAVLLIVVVLDPFSPKPSRGSSGVFRILRLWAQEQVETNAMPRDVPVLLDEAWRQETANNRSVAAKVWMKVHVSLDIWDQQQHFDASPSDTGLKLLQSGKATTLPYAEMRTALKQFVINMERLK